MCNYKTMVTVGDHILSSCILNYELLREGGREELRTVSRGVLITSLVFVRHIVSQSMIEGG